MEKPNELIRLNNNDTGTFLVFTKSGSQYLINLLDNKRTLKRTNPKYFLRRDGEELIIMDFKIEVGKSARFILEPLGLGNSTTRITTIVEKIVMITDDVY